MQFAALLTTLDHPQFLPGNQDLRPRKLAIDVSPERNGESPADEFRERLMPLGYEIRQRRHVMFAKQKS